MVFKICVVSGKGGTGKTTLSSTLSNILSEKFRVLLVDADVECPNIHLFFKKVPFFNLRDVFVIVPKIDKEKCKGCGRCVKVCRKNAIFQKKEGTPPIVLEDRCNGCKACFIACPFGAIKEKRKKVGVIRYKQIKDNFILLSGIIDIGKEEPMPIVRELLKEVKNREQSFDVIIIDSAPGIKCNVAAVIEESDIVFVVVEPTPFGIRDAKKVLELVNILGKTPYIIINKLMSEEDVNIIKEELSCNILGKVPYSEEIVKGYLEGRCVGIDEIEDIIVKIEEMLREGGKR